MTEETARYVFLKDVKKGMIVETIDCKNFTKHKMIVLDRADRNNVANIFGRHVTQTLHVSLIGQDTETGEPLTLQGWGTNAVIEFFSRGDL